MLDNENMDGKSKIDDTILNILKGNIKAEDAIREDQMEKVAQIFDESEDNSEPAERYPASVFRRRAPSSAFSQVNSPVSAGNQVSSSALPRTASATNCPSSGIRATARMRFGLTRMMRSPSATSVKRTRSADGCTSAAGSAEEDGSAGAGAFVQPLNTPVPSRDITVISVIDFLKGFINISVSIQSHFG